MVRIGDIVLVLATFGAVLIAPARLAAPDVRDFAALLDERLRAGYPPPTGPTR